VKLAASLLALSSCTNHNSNLYSLP